MNYYDTLERIKRTATLLQGLPIPPGELGQGRNLGRLEVAAEALRRMLVEVAPQVEVWCGSREGARGRPLARDFDPLLEPLYTANEEETPGESR